MEKEKKQEKAAFSTPYEKNQEGRAILPDSLLQTGSIKGNWLLLVTKTGLGEQEFGQYLLRQWFASLAALEIPPQAIYLVNSGVKLACKNSPVLSELLLLWQKNVQIVSCDLSLDYYQLKESLCVGEIGNSNQMTETVALIPKVVVF